MHKACGKPRFPEVQDTVLDGPSPQSQKTGSRKNTGGCWAARSTCGGREDAGRLGWGSMVGLGKLRHGDARSSNTRSCAYQVL